ncbi:uncharacterized protein LOC134535148 isoform X2 [Bacillus rossius redtenbacheri]|uniref:uncharacterized protein LOC134535148 isoform X2 n=1 Tax=Bacillus rossius redtenbacheri TaxID=93214 RepID=UPI002FDE0220
MSGRGFNFLVEMFPDMDREVLSDICASISSDEEVHKAVASLLETGREGATGSRDHEVPQAPGPPLAANSASHARERGKYPHMTPQGTQSKACDATLSGNAPPTPGSVQRWFAGQAPHQARYFPQPQHYASVPYEHQPPVPLHYLQPFYTSPYPLWPPTRGAPCPYFLPSDIGHVSAPCCLDRPEQAGCTGKGDVKPSLWPRQEAQEEKVLNSMPDLREASQPLLGRDGDGPPEQARESGSIVQQDTANSCRSSETTIASHYLSLVTILPDSDPSFIRRKCEEINGNVSKLQKFVVEALTLDNYEKNSSVSVLQDKSMEKSLPAVCEDVSSDVYPAERTLEINGAFAGGEDPRLLEKLCVSATSASSDEGNASGPNLVPVEQDVTLGFPAEVEDCTHPFEASLSESSFDDSSYVEIVDCDDAAGAPCAVSSENEFELTLEKLADASSGNESCQPLELGSDTSDCSVSEVAPAPAPVGPACDESSVLEVRGGSGELPTDSVVEVVCSSCKSADQDIAGRECSSDEAAMPSDRGSGVDEVLSRSEDSEAPVQTHMVDMPLPEASRELDDDFPPELFEVDPDTANDYELAKMISKQDDESPWKCDPLEEKINLLLNFMPDADPSYLKDICEWYAGDETQLQAVVQESLESNRYPTFEDYLCRQKTLGLIRETLDQLTIPGFLEGHANPFEYFYGSRIKEPAEAQHELGFLQRRYRSVENRDLQAVLDKCDHNLTLACKELDSWSGAARRHARGDWECELPSHVNMSFVHEVFFIMNERELREYLELEGFRKTVLDRARFIEAKLECPICCDEELEIVEMAACAEGHLFCKACVKRSAETRIGDGLTTFPCLEDSCTAEFGTRTLESLLNHTLFTRMVQQRSLQEVESAQIQDLVRCPFCEYAAILPPDLSVLVCENTECLKETCRYCKEPNHIPLRCSEVEKEGETKMRTEIEDRMTDAVIRKCNSCSKKFIKSDGCNKMVCPCGAIMCYLCRARCSPTTAWSTTRR